MKKYIFVVLVLLTTLSLAHARTIAFPGEYPTITEAVNAAVNGDVIVIAPSSQPYYITESITIDSKAITIRSEDPTDPTVVASTVLYATAGTDGKVSTPLVIKDCGADTTVSGLTITFGPNSYIFSLNGKDGIESANPLEAAGEPGKPIRGGAIDLDNSSPTLKYLVIKDCEIRSGNGGNGANGNLVDDGGGGTTATDGGEGGLPGDARGAGIFCGGNSSPKVYHCDFINLKVKAGNGGNGGDAFSDDTNSTDPGLAKSPSEILAAGSIAAGAAVFTASGASPEFYYCTFTNCHSQSGVCGLSGKGTDGYRPFPNYNYNVETHGGAVYINGSSGVIFDHCTFTDNEAETDVAEYNNYIYISSGGALYGKNGSVTIRDCTFGTNKATMGAACFFDGTNASLYDSKFNENTAYNGGALYANTGSNLKLSADEFQNNVAIVENSPAGSGGAVYTWNTAATIVDSIFESNTAKVSGGAIYCGGYDSATPRKAKLLNDLIVKNTATNSGGGVCATADAKVEIKQATIADNTAAAGGGLEITYGADVLAVNTIFWENSSSDPNNADQIDVGIFDHDSDPDTPVSNPSTLDIKYSDVMGGRSGVNVYSGDPDDATDNAEVTWDYASMLSGNASSRPWFVKGDRSDYYLNRNQEGNPYDVDSPCIDKGKDISSSFVLYRHTTDINNILESGTTDIGYYNLVDTNIKGDFDYSGLVDATDLSIIASWNTHNDCAFPDWCEGTDLDMDGNVNNTDLAIFATNYDNDTTAPWPDPLKWEVKPRSSSGSSSVYLRVADARDNTGCQVTYTFRCYNPDGTLKEAISQAEDQDDLEAQEARECTFAGLTVGSEYSFDVIADDRLHPFGGATNTTLPTSRVYVVVGNDYSPPSPSPSQWAIAPVPASHTSVRMTAVAASDESGVEYNFRYIGGEANNEGELVPGHDSGWQSSNEYVDTGLSAGAKYTYTVQTRDKSANVNAGDASEEASCRLPEIDDNYDFDPPTTPDPIYYGAELDTYAPGVYHYMIAPATSTDDSGVVKYGFECKEESGFNTLLYEEDGEIHNGGIYSLWFADGQVYLRIKVRTLENGSGALPLTWRVVVEDPTGKRAYSSWYLLNDPGQ